MAIGAKGVALGHEYVKGPYTFLEIDGRTLVNANRLWHIQPPYYQFPILKHLIVQRH